MVLHYRRVGGPIFLGVLLCIQWNQAQVLQAGDTCRVLSLIPFADWRCPPDPVNVLGYGPCRPPPKDIYGYGTWSNAETLAKASFSLMAAAEMARRHFNARDTSVVPELHEIVGCNITMPDPESNNVLYVNSAYNRNVALSEVHRVHASESGDVCSFVGPVYLQSIVGLGVLAEHANIPLLSYRTKFRRLASLEEYPNVVRLLSENFDFGKAVLTLLHHGLHRDYAAVLHEDSEYGSEFDEAFRNTNFSLGFRVSNLHFAQGRVQRESMLKSLGAVVRSGVRTIVLVTDHPSVVALIADAAHELGLLGKGFIWYLLGETLSIELLSTWRYTVDSPMDMLLRGDGLITHYDPFVYFGETDPFLTAWRQQDGSSVELLNRIQPKQENGAPFYMANSSYFQVETPALYSSFIYDSVMTAGISACKAHENKINHMDEVLQTKFQGASGRVEFSFLEDIGLPSTTRDRNSVFYGLYNIRPRGSGEEDGLQR